MDKETFLQELKHDLRYLNRKNREEELAKYANLDNYNLDPIDEANKIYAIYNKNIVLYHILTFKDAVGILIANLQSKDKNKIKKVLLFFLYLIFLLIIIKMPFIYIRDMATNFFGELFMNPNSYTIWSLIIEFIYALTTILVFIRLIKKKAAELDKIEKND